MCNKGECYKNLTAMEYLGVSTVILSGRSMPVIVNSQSSEAHEINAIIFRGSLLILDDQCLAADRSFGVTLTDQLKKKSCLASFNTSKTKLTFHHHRADTEPAPILMGGHTPQKGYERLQDLKIIPDLKYTYICAIAENAGRIHVAIYKSDVTRM